MSIQVILPTKRVIDVRPFIVDFAQYLAEGETISNAVASVSLYTGIDPSPDELLYLPPEIINNTVHQRVKAGIPGNIYLVTIVTTTSLGHELTAEAFQAVIPDGVPADDIYIDLYFTTPPYPLSFVDALDSSSAIMDSTFLDAYIEGIDVTTAIISGELRALLLEYVMLPEAIDSTSDIQSGELRQILLSYSYAEAIDSTTSIQSGILVIALIQYTNWPAEAIDSTTAIISGSLI